MPIEQRATIEHTATVPGRLAGRRLDQALAELFPSYSRSRLKEWILAGRVRVDRAHDWKPRDRLSGGERIILSAYAEQEVSSVAQAVPLDIVFEDAHLIVVNKQPGLVVHPGAGNPDQTLQNGLLHYAPELDRVPRAGLVHRLDKDTSGLLVVARTLEAHTRLVAAMQAREIKRSYEAVTRGVMTGGGTVDAPIGRHPRDRIRMAVREGGRAAVTRYRVIERFRAHTHAGIELETGRTHQIRVHLAHIAHPLVGDPLYGRRLALPAHVSDELASTLRCFRRQALHARSLEFLHPVHGEQIALSRAPPADMQALLDALRADTAASAP